MPVSGYIYHQALVYCLGLSEDTRRNINQIYDFATGYIKPGCLRKGWQTSGSQKIVRIAFNLYTDGTPMTEEIDDTEEQIVETRLYSVSDIFCTGDVGYFQIKGQIGIFALMRKLKGQTKAKGRE